MKDKILMLIIGILLGAVIASGCFLLFENSNSNREGFEGRPDMNQNMEDGGMKRGEEGVQPPETENIITENVTSNS